MREYLRWRYAVAVLAIAVLGVFAIRSNHSNPPPPAAASTATAPAPTGPDPAAATATPNDGGTVSQAPTADPADVAAKFITAWASRGPAEPVGPWLDRMRPYAGPPLLSELAMTAPGAIQAHQVTGPARTVNAGQYGAQVTVPVDAGPVPLCGLVNDGTGWKVTTLDAVDPDPS